LHSGQRAWLGCPGKPTAKLKITINLFIGDETDQILPGGMRFLIKFYGFFWTKFLG